MLKYVLNKNEINIKLLAFLFVMPIFCEFISVLMHVFGINDTLLVTTFIYLLLMFLIIINNKIMITDVIKLLLIYLFFLINCLIFPDSIKYVTDKKMYIVLFFVFPYCILLINKIRVYDKLFLHLNKYSKIGIIESLILLFFDTSKYISYMSFSYNLLPAILSVYICYKEKYLKTNKRVDLFFIIIGYLELLVYGARATVLYALIFIPIYNTIIEDVSIYKKVTFIVILLVVSLIVLNNYRVIVSYLLSTKIFADSRFLEKIMSGELASSQGRVAIYTDSIARIKSMGFEISGLFGDRKYIIGELYPHNIIIELLMQFGWVIGGILITVLITIIINSLRIQNHNNRNIAIYIIISMLGRYLISGSYLIENFFWIGITVLVNLIIKFKYEK